MAPGVEKSNETSSSEGEHVDRISDLPVAIIHHIFSFLDNNYTTRISMLSKKWRQMCLSSPYLYFAENEKDNVSLDCEEFINFLYSFLSKRDKSTIHSFHLDLFPNEMPILDAWISELAKYNVQELNLNLHILLSGRRFCYLKGEVFSFPPSFFSCKSLRVLELNLVNNHLLDLPLMNFPLLEVLSLDVGNLVCKLSFQEWISTCCPSLKKLTLSGKHKLKTMQNNTIEDLTIKMIRGNITPTCIISGDNLKTLSLDVFNYRGCVFKVFAPKLQVLKWGGKWANTSRIGLGNFTSLSKATIIVDRIRWANKSAFNYLVDVLNRASSAKVLCLHVCVIEIFLIKDQEPMLFENVRQLDIIVDNWKDYHIPAIGSFVQRLPNLVTLTIERKPVYRTSWGPKANKLLRSRASNFSMGEERSENTPFSTQLKQVEIHLSSFDEEATDVKLVKFLIETLDELEKLAMFYPSSSLMGSSSFVGNIQKCYPRLAIVSLIKELEEKEEEVYYYTDTDEEWTDGDYEIAEERRGEQEEPEEEDEEEDEEEEEEDDEEEEDEEEDDEEEEEDDEEEEVHHYTDNDEECTYGDYEIAEEDRRGGGGGGGGGEESRRGGGREEEEDFICSCSATTSRGRAMI